jgi:hypothetical protein
MNADHTSVVGGHAAQHPSHCTPPSTANVRQATGEPSCCYQDGENGRPLLQASEPAALGSTPTHAGGGCTSAASKALLRACVAPLKQGGAWHAQRRVRGAPAAATHTQLALVVASPSATRNRNSSKTCSVCVLGSRHRQAGLKCRLNLPHAGPVCRATQGEHMQPAREVAGPTRTHLRQWTAARARAPMHSTLWCKHSRNRRDALARRRRVCSTQRSPAHSTGVRAWARCSTTRSSASRLGTRWLAQCKPATVSARGTR